ncbi:HisA/HisF-related TIM barrel protein [Isosphaeraceae bacterium EP7]
MPIRLIPVLDLKGGQAVHAVAGNRAHYRPIRGRLHQGSDPIGLSLAYRDSLGLEDLYLADLDAIEGQAPSYSLYHEISRLGINLWVDAGLAGPGPVLALLDAGVRTIVAGLESLGSPLDLAEIVQTAGAGRVAFSLDLRDGAPIVAPGSAWREPGNPDSITREAVEAGVGHVIVLDLARVGLGRGTGASDLIRRLSPSLPGVRWVAGGGVAGVEDLDELGRAGAVGALVGTALHRGVLTRTDLERFRH